MRYGLFSRLYREAGEYSSLDMYIAERGWQEWMDDYGTEEDTGKIVSILETIYQLYNMTLEEMRKKVCSSRAEFSRMYGIPVRTLEDWDNGKSNINSYIKSLIAYTVFCETEGKERS